MNSQLSDTNQDGRRNVLIVDDEDSVRESLSLLLKNNFNVLTANNGEDAMKIVESGSLDLVLLDVMMPKLDGVETLKKIKDNKESLPVIMLTASNSVPTAVEAMKLGAIDYLNKPFDIEALSSLIVNTIRRNEGGDEIPQAEVPVLAKKKESKAVSQDISGDFGALVGTSQLMQSVFKRVEQVAQKDTTVIITGESGTGKELIAKRIYELSARRDAQFVAINCAAIPETLIESELFGHEKGAFTSAVEKRLGYFELANGGTIFLDEIGELSLAVQVKMLRFLQEHEFYRVGDSRPRKVDVRVIVATNKDLEEQVRKSEFRQDLFYRINVININLPPLRDRFEDIMALAAHFVKKYSPAYDDRLLHFNKDAAELLVQYSWPGNVRELENVVESLMALSLSDQVKASDLPPVIINGSDNSRFNSDIFKGSMKFQDAEREFEKEMILKALQKTNYVQTKASELLGISRRILKYKMDKLGISDELL